MEKSFSPLLPLALGVLIVTGWPHPNFPTLAAEWAGLAAAICPLDAAKAQRLDRAVQHRRFGGARVTALPRAGAGIRSIPDSRNGYPAGGSCPLHSNLCPSGCIISAMNFVSAAGAGETADDGALVTAARSGDRGAYAGLYRRHAGRLMPALWRLTGGDRSRAEDLLQDAFVAGWQKLDQLREPAAFGGWIRRLAVNLALADRRRLRPISVDSTPEAAAPEPPWPAADLDLERAIALLPDRARQVLVLFHLEGFSHDEIAGFMNINTGTSKAQLHRARRLVREMLA